MLRSSSTIMGLIAKLDTGAERRVPLLEGGRPGTRNNSSSQASLSPLHTASSVRLASGLVPVDNPELCTCHG
jgi:hypothetical protein